MTLVKNTHTYAVLAVLVAIVFVAFVTPAYANTMTLSSEPSSYFELKAKVVYLQAFLEALLDGDMSPAPTFISSLNGDVISITGTVARNPNPDMMELCGPMIKGQIEWGDGVVESIRGLGCSGDAQMFAMHHRYAESGSYEIRIKDQEGRSERHVVAVRAGTDEGAPDVEVTQDKNEVEVRGDIALDNDLPKTCEATAIAMLNWGDGNTNEITTDCTDTEFSATHAYATAGVYKLSVRDLDGDMTQTLVTVE